MACTHARGGGGGGGGVKTNLKARTVTQRFVQQKSYYWSKYCLKITSHDINKRTSVNFINNLLHRFEREFFFTKREMYIESENGALLLSTIKKKKKMTKT